MIVQKALLDTISIIESSVPTATHENHTKTEVPFNLDTILQHSLEEKFHQRTH